MKFNIFAKPIKSLDKIDKPVTTFSEKYCKNIDIRASIKSLPGIGSLLDNLISYKGSKIIQERADLFFEETKEALRILKYEKIDRHFFEGEEGFYVFYKIYEQVLRCKEKEKIRYFRNIFINSITLGKSDHYYKERFVNIVADLSVKHLEILKYYIEREAVFNKESRQDGARFTSLEGISQKFEMKIPHVEAFCNDLLRYDLLYDDAIGKYDYERGKYRITKSAIDFIDFVTFG